MTEMTAREAARVDAFREDFRAREVPRDYRWRRHLLGLVGVCCGAIVLALWQLEATTGWQWSTVPCCWVFANLVEYLAHRHLMHRPRWPVTYLYRRHSGAHHRFFVDHKMSIDTTRDLPAVIFPVRVSLFFLAGVASPAALVLGWLWSSNVGWLFLAAGTAYYLAYELLHLGAHLPETSWWARARVVRGVRRHHAMHHAPRAMRHTGFNISLPLWDWLLKTTPVADDA